MVLTGGPKVEDSTHKFQASDLTKPQNLVWVYYNDGIMQPMTGRIDNDQFLISSRLVNDLAMDAGLLSVSLSEIPV